ncbi:MAG TPA: GAF domain-containing protein [Candidatus Binatia bacterium]|jgi:GAF domain-containing protein
MAIKTKKGSQNNKAKLQRPNVKMSLAKQDQTIAELRQQLAQSLKREKTALKDVRDRDQRLAEALEQQSATGEILRVIASSPTELQSVLDTLLANAVKLSGATMGHIRKVDGQFYRVVSHYGESPERISFLRSNPLPANPNMPMGRAIIERKPVHIPDLRLESGPAASFSHQTSARTVLATPLLREDTPIGVIIIWRDFVEAFTHREIELVKTFADQAVIAIENVRLFNELKESLDQQTATSEILGVIASSPTSNQCSRRLQQQRHGCATRAML